MPQTFWQQKRGEIQENPGRNEGEQIGVQIVDSEAAPGEFHWEIIGIYLLSPQENGGNHNVFLDAVRDGNVVRGLVIDWGWEGMTPAEKRHIDSQPLYLKKSPLEFGGDIAPHAGQIVWGRIKDQPSQTFTGFDIRRTGPGGGQSWGHWSIYVVFEWKVKGLPEPPPEEPGEQPAELINLKAFLQRANAVVVRHINEIFEELIQLADE